VDGIGGITWDGTLLMCRLLQSLHLTPLHVLELGCGSGLSGLVASALAQCTTVTLTDQEVDLAELNVRGRPGIVALPLPWGEDCGPVIESRGRPHVIIGCEVACLRRQQDKLVRSIQTLALPETVVLVSFDEGPQPNTCSAERDLDLRMQGLGFRKDTLSAGRVVWERVDPSEERAALEDLSMPLGCSEHSACHGYGVRLESTSSETRSGPVSSDNCSIGTHHICAYFKETALCRCSTCGELCYRVFQTSS
jgi:hypothetical protein